MGICRGGFWWSKSGEGGGGWLLLDLGVCKRGCCGAAELKQHR